MPSAGPYRDLLRACRRKLTLSEWFRGLSVREYAQHLASEVDEVLRAIDARDAANLEEELGDVFWVIHALILKAGQEHGFTLDDVISGVVRKFRRRKPHIFSGRPVSRDQEIARWLGEKVREKTRAARRRADVTRPRRSIRKGGRPAASNRPRVVALVREREHRLSKAAGPSPSAHARHRT